MTPLRAVVFDLDGTLVDNMGIHMEAFSVFVEEHGLPPMTEELRRRLDGKRNRDIFPVLFGCVLEEEALARYGREKEATYRRIARGRLVPVRGLVALLDHLELRELPVAVATSAPAENVPYTLGELNLQDRFPLVVRGDEVARGKPHPDVFEEAARRLAVPADDCLAFEDSLAGVEAAHAAGMQVVAITTTFSRADFDEQGLAHASARDFAEWKESEHAAPMRAGDPAP